MKSRRVVISFDIETDLPIKELREAKVTVLHPPTPGNWRAASYVDIIPVNKPRVEVIQPVKKRKKDR